MAEPLPCGIYFGLDSEVYHADKALSRSNLVDLLDTPNTYWLNSWMNKKRKRREPTKDMLYGAAVDCALFQPEIFHDKFEIVPIDPWSETKLKIEEKLYNNIIASKRVIQASKDSARFLSGGMPHVTIVFDWNGMRFRCEHDYFMANGSTDYKAVYSLHDFHLQKSFRQYGLDIQMALYKKSRDEFKKAYRTGTAKVFGDVSAEFFKKFMASEMNEFMFIFQRNTEPFPFRPIFPEDDTEESGLTKIDEAVDIYQRHMKQFGADKPWPVCSGKPEVFSMYYGKR